MVAPISNDKITPSDSNSRSVSDNKRADQGTVNQNAADNEALTQSNSGVDTDSVDVERANQIYSRSTSKLSSGEEPITSSEQAKSLVAEIRTQIEANASQALKAQTGAASSSLSALLEAAPV